MSKRTLTEKSEQTRSSNRTLWHLERQRKLLCFLHLFLDDLFFRDVESGAAVVVVDDGVGRAGQGNRPVQPCLELRKCSLHFSVLVLQLLIWVGHSQLALHVNWVPNPLETIDFDGITLPEIENRNDKELSKMAKLKIGKLRLKIKLTQHFQRSN